MIGSILSVIGITGGLFESNKAKREQDTAAIYQKKALQYNTLVNKSQDLDKLNANLGRNEAMQAESGLTNNLISQNISTINNYDTDLRSQDIGYYLANAGIDIDNKAYHRNINDNIFNNLFKLGLMGRKL